MNQLKIGDSLSKKTSIGRRPSDTQKEALLDWLEQNIDIASTKCTDSDGIRERDTKWEEIAFYLNSLGRAKKNGIKWRKFWTDLRNYTRSKWLVLQQQDSSVLATKKVTSLSSIEERVLALVFPSTITTDKFKGASANFEVDNSPVVKIEKCFSADFDVEEKDVLPIMRTDNDLISSIKIEENSVENFSLNNSFTESTNPPSIVQPKLLKSRRPTFSSAYTKKKLINIEVERLKIEKAKLRIKKEKLKVAKELLEVQKVEKDVLVAILEQIKYIKYKMFS